jgi:hypothetical protein
MAALAPPTLAGAAIGAVFVGVMTGSLLYRKTPPTGLALSRRVIAQTRTFTISPERFLERPFFLLDFIQSDADLSKGKWKVILTRSGCPRCDRRLRSVGCRPEGDERVALVQAGGKPGWTPPGECQATFGYLSRDKTWVFDAPLTFRVVDGVVKGIR